MDFETWFKQHVPNAPAGKYHEFLAVWEAATQIERERCAKQVEDAGAYTDWNEEAVFLAAAIRAT